MALVARDAKPRVALLEPQRLFGHALTRALAKDFDVVCCVSELDGLRGIERIDLAVIDIDAVEMPAGEVLETAQVLLDGAMLCLLGLDPPHDYAVPAPETYVYAPKTASQNEFVEFVREMTLPASI